MRAFAIALAAFVVLVPAAAAKDFKPGDIRVCGADRCVPLRSVRVLASLSAFYYGPHKPAVAAAPSKHASFLELRFRNGYVTGAAAGARFDRFLSFDVNLGQFSARTWYAVPPRISTELRRLAAGLRPQALPDT